MVSAPRIVGGMLVVAALAPVPGAAQVAGTVVDDATSEPLEGALVTVQASEVETTTGADGRFALPGAGGSGLVIAAGRVGYFNGAARGVGAPATGVEIRLDAVPVVDDPTYVPRLPDSCGRCHPWQDDEWSGSAMRHAGTNTWVHDVYDGTGTAGGEGGFVYTRDSAHAGENPASECRACHQPLAWMDDPFTPLGDADDPTDLEREGVSCEVCHKIAEVDESLPNYPGLHPDAVRFTRPDPGGWNVQYGSLPDAIFVSPGEMRASWQPQVRAALCMTCHQDRNDLDGDGDFDEDDGPISEPTWLEWLESPYADPESEHYATCADCHMEPADHAACNWIIPPLERPVGDVRSHRFEGTTPRYLENAASLSLEARREGGRLEIEVTVENESTGHHLPTGVTIRNVILLVEATRAVDGEPLEHLGEQVVHELGGVGDPGEGYFAGLPGKLFAKINHGPDGTGPVFYTEATGILDDTRIPALESDTTAHAFALPDEDTAVRVRARLIYRRSWRVLVDAKGWTTDGHGQPLEDLAPPHFGHLMESAERTIGELPGPDAGTPETDAGTGPTADAGPPPPDEGGSCRCATPGPQNGAGSAAIACVLLLLVAARRRAIGARRARGPRLSTTEPMR